MKKKLLTVILILFFTNLYAQNFNQILMPQKVYIGDTAELRITFNSGLEEINNQFEKNNTITLSTDKFETPLSDDYVVKNIMLQKTGINYFNLVIEFVPWKTGVINFPSYDVGLSVGNQSFLVEIKPVSVMSILDQNNGSLRDFTAPLLLPGTTWKIWIMIILFLIVIGTIIKLIVSHKQVYQIIENIRLSLRFRKNQKEALKKLDKAENLEDKEFAEEIQSLLRFYLDVRWGVPFTKKTTSEMMDLYQTAVEKIVIQKKLVKDERWDSAIQLLLEIFKKTDTVRYGKSAHFDEGERFQIAEKIRSAMNDFGTRVVNQKNPKEKKIKELMEGEVQNA